MRRIVLAAGLTSIGLGLAGCGSTSSLDFGFLTPTPPSVELQIDFRPPGAQAVTSLGPGCKTPCTVTVPVAESFSVTFTLDRYTSQTVPVQITQTSVVSEDAYDPAVRQGPLQIDPNPVFAQLEPARRAPAKRAAPRPKSTASAPPPSSAFPPPPR